MSNTIFHILLAVIPAIVAITLHEAAHGYAAWALGDDTAKNEGRLSLNPLVHVDRVGTILLPGFLILFQLLTLGKVGFLFGWAKPVPVAAWKFENPRRGMMLVAAAGPLMNFFLAWLGALALHPISSMDGATGATLGLLAQYFILTNLVLGLFNLLPIPPLDGGRIAVGLLPLPLARVWARFERAGILIVILLVFLLPRVMAEFDIDFNPVGDALDAVVPWAIHIIMVLAGLDGRPGNVLSI
jgi:Zn-dependent protease